MARPSYSESRVQEIEERIYEAALTVFGREGFTNFSLRAVAREMGLTPPALYRYVDNKDRLLAEIRAEGFRRLGAIFDETRAMDGEPAMRVRAMVRAYLDFAFEEPELYRAMYELDQGEAPMPEWAHNVRQTAFNSAVEMAKEFIDAGGYQIKPVQLVHLWWSAIHGLAGLDLANQLNMGCDRAELVEPIVTMVTNTGFLKSI